MEIEIKGYKVLIDDEDWEKVKQYSWRVCKKEEKQGLFYFHAATKRDPITNKQKDIRLHRLIIGCTVGDGFLVDHINHNTLDNRKCNLRKTSARGNVCNSRISSRNTSGYKGVSWNKRDKVYQSAIKYKGKSYSIGKSPDIIVAAKLYDMMAIKLFGEYACLNFPEEAYSKKDIDILYERVTDKMYTTNTSGYIGVSKTKNKWTASIQCNKIQYYLGTFANIIEAAKARDKKAIELFGEEAILNFPKEEYTKELQGEQKTEN